MREKGILPFGRAVYRSVVLVVCLGINAGRERMRHDVVYGVLKRFLLDNGQGPGGCEPNE